MKKQTYVFLTVFLVCIPFFTCTKGVSMEELVRAEKQMEANPNSALAVLNSIRSPQKMSKAHYAEYCLLLTEARDKNYYRFTSDSLIRVAVAYYEGMKDNRKLPKAYYYRGRVCQELKEIAGLYIDLGEYGEAASCLYKVARLMPDKSAPDQLKLTYAHFYQQTGKSDSALYYLNQSIQSENIYTKAASYYRLYQIAKAGQNYRQALAYADTCHLYKDSIAQQAGREESLRIQYLYNFQKITAEKEQLKRRNNQKQQLIILLIIISFSGILFTVMLFLYQRQHRKNELLIKEKQLRLQKELYEKSLKHIEENMRKIASLTDKVQKNEARLNQTGKALLEKQMELLRQGNSQIELTDETKRLQYETLLSSPIYKSLKNTTPGETLNKELWNAFKQTADQIYDCLETKLRVYCPKISGIELKVCYLINTGFSITEIAHLIGRTNSAVTHCRKRLYEKIHGSPGSGDDLDRFIANL
jgi:hypothetical protein